MFSVSFEVIVNGKVIFQKEIVSGKAHDWFQVTWCTREGDPLSPFLFTLAVDGLSRMMIWGLKKGL